MKYGLLWVLSKSNFSVRGFDKKVLITFSLTFITHWGNALFFIKLKLTKNDFKYSAISFCLTNQKRRYTTRYNNTLKLKI